MIQHVTLYTLKNVDQLSFVKEQLEKLKECPLIIENKVVVNYLKDLPPVKHPMFAHIAHFATFENEENAQAFPACPEHLALVKATDAYIKEVMTMDYVD